MYFQHIYDKTLAQGSFFIGCQKAGATEYKQGHIDGAEHIFVGHLQQQPDRVETQKPVVIHCQSGDRAAIGYSILVKNGFHNVFNFSGGIKEWTANQKPLKK